MTDTIAVEPMPAEAPPWETEPKRPERSLGPRVRSEITVSPETNIEPYDYGAGCHLWIGVPFESYVLVALGWDERTRRDACDRLIAALTEVRNWTPTAVPS